MLLAPGTRAVVVAESLTGRFSPLSAISIRVPKPPRRAATHRAVREYLAALTQSHPFAGMTDCVRFARRSAGRQFVMTRMHDGAFVPLAAGMQ
jgi:hypothetical protein